MNKKTGELAVIRKVWLESDFPEIPESGHAIQFSASVSALAFENQHGVIFILPPKVYGEFEDLGEL